MKWTGMPYQDENSDRDLRIEDPWAQTFFGYLAEKTRGNEAWGRLLFGGNPVLLVRLAAAIVAGSPQELELYRNELKSTGKTLRASVPKVHAIADLVENLNKQAAKHKMMILTEFQELPERLRAYAKELEDYSNIALEQSSERLSVVLSAILTALHIVLLVNVVARLPR
jgi:hypothetical protein